MELFLVLLLASTAAFATAANDFKLKADDYFQEITAEITYDLGAHANGKMNLMNNYSIDIGGSPFRLSLNNGTIVRLANISHSGAGNAVYPVPAVSSVYTIGDALLQFEFVLASNLSSVSSSNGEVTLELSGVRVSVVISAHETAAGKYASAVVKDKLSVVGNLDNIKLSKIPNQHMVDFVELWYRSHSHSISTAIHREFSSYFHTGVTKVDVSKYVEQ